MSDAIDDLFSSATTRQLSTGERLFFVGDPVTSMMRVKSGAVALSRVTELGSVLTLQIARHADVLAEASLHSTHYHCEAAAREASEIAILPVQDFRTALRNNTELVEAWVRNLSRTVQVARFNSEIRTLKTVSGRVDAWLSINETLPPRGHWQELATEIGVSREALYRELSRRRRVS